MKICFIAFAVSIHTQLWVEWFTKRGHKVHIISSALPLEVLDKLKNAYLHEFNLDNYSSIVKMIPFKSIWLAPFLCRKIIKKSDLILSMGIL